MDNKIQIAYSGASMIVGIVYDPTGTKAWDYLTATWIGPPISNATDLTNASNLLVVDQYNAALFWFDFPQNIVESGDFVVGLYELSGGVPVTLTGLIALDTRLVRWDGLAVVSQAAANISLSSVGSADAYFKNMLYTQSWFNSNTSAKQQALNHATKIINMFSYIGRKTVADQINEWPRTGVLVNNVELSGASVPQDILNAQYEIALSLAKGIDPEQEIRSMRVTSRGFGSVRTTYDPRALSQHLMFGVPSALGWSYLSTYFKRDANGSIKLHRVS